jgi:FKBP-type peptidyl-prolyl cis-trans isomerase 2
MTLAKDGDTVKIHYTGKLSDGTIFDTSRARQPIQFTLGKGAVIAGFEQAVLGMAVGERKTATIPVDQAYGRRRDDMIVTLQRSTLPQELIPQVGQRLELEQENNRSILVTVTEVTDATMTVDGNHPLAGKDLTFELELVGII